MPRLAGLTGLLNLSEVSASGITQSAVPSANEKYAPAI
jgi:hypothetical protein